MKGDFSRLRFTPGKHFTSVLEQQGRVSLDADANEQGAIDEYLRGVQAIDTIGGVGGPRDDAGFEITVTPELTIHISGGRYYVHGLLCDNSARDYMVQPYLVTPSATDEDLLSELQANKTTAICVELQVWQRLVTALDDPCLLEPALGQADTTARLQTVWRVVATPVNTAVKLIPVVTTDKPGKLCVQLNPTANDCSCQPIPPAGYQGLENQLYRIEIHQPGDETSASFKWSRENASIVAAITSSSNSNGQTTIFVDSLGKDPNLGFAANQWVEISDDRNEFGATPNQPGSLWQIASVSAKSQPPSITFDTIIPSVTPPVNLAYNPRVRRWDQPGTETALAGTVNISASTTVTGTGTSFTTSVKQGQQLVFGADTTQTQYAIASIVSDTKLILAQPYAGTASPTSSVSVLFGDIPLSSTTPIDIENGIQATFVAGKYWSGDYWLVPARTASATIVWPPPCGDDGNCSQPAEYIHIHTAPLALITRNELHTKTDEGDEAKPLEANPFVVQDLRSFFAPLSASAMHIEDFYWTNDDLMTLDTLVTQGLQIDLDRAPTSSVDAAEFRVSVEIPQWGRDYQNYLTDADRAAKFAELWPQMSSIAVATGMLRQDYVLDGVISTDGQTLTWNLPTDLREESDPCNLVIYVLNMLLQEALNALLELNPQPQPSQLPKGVSWYARVRVRLLGHMIYLQTASTSGQCGQTKTLFLDGQCFGEPGTRTDGTTGIGLALPSGNSATASDFESWFYLAPMAEVDDVTFEAYSIQPTNGVATNTGTVTLEGPVTTTTTIDLVATLASASGGTVPSAITVTVPATITIAAGGTSQTFTVSVSVPPAVTSVSFTCTVTATPELECGLGEIFSASQSFNVQGNPPVITTVPPLPNGTVGVGYSTTLSATGGTPPYLWSVAPNTLPAGLTLDAKLGIIAGTPKLAGTYTFSPQLSDSETPPASAASVSFSITVSEPLSITTTALPGGTVGTVYPTVTLEATGGTPPYVWSVSGVTPGNVEFISNGTIQGTGALLSAGTFTFTVQVRDPASPSPTTATKQFTITIAPAP